MDDGELDVLLALDGVAFELAPSIVVEFTARRTDVTRERPHGISYALVLRGKHERTPWVRFDNAHAVRPRGGLYLRKPAAYDHWHRSERDKGRSYSFTTVTQLL